MVTNYGKKFESVIKESFEKVPNTLVTRLYDSTNGFLGVKTPCDFIVYHYPHQYMIECKSVHGNTLPFSNITDNQWNGLLEASKIKGVIAGVICWLVDKDVTAFIPIWYLHWIKTHHPGVKSINANDVIRECDEIESHLEFKNPHFIRIQGKKKRVFFDYDMNQFFKEVENGKY